MNKDKTRIPINKLIIIDPAESAEFIENFNKNKISQELLESCRKAGKLFKRK